MIFLLAALLWHKNWDTAFAQARQEHKLVFVDYAQAPCPDCFNLEHLAGDEPALAKALDEFVLLRVNSMPAQFRVQSPAFVIFDAAGRERLRIEDKHGFRADDWHGAEKHKPIEVRDPHAEKKITTDVGGVLEPIARFRAAAPAFVQAAELFDAKHDLEANFLVGNTYGRLKMTEHARAAYAEAKAIAEQQGNAAAAQVAAAQSAFTYVAEQRAPHAIELLKPLMKAPVNRETEALTWLLLGHAYESAADKQEAVEAFQRAKSLAAAGSRTEQDASAALARLQ